MQDNNNEEIQRLYSRLKDISDKGQLVYNYKRRKCTIQWIWIDLDQHGTMLFSISDGKAGLLVGWKPHLLNEAAISNKQSAKKLIFRSAILDWTIRPNPEGRIVRKPEGRILP